MKNYQGQSRVIIESVSPEINNGQFYAKAIEDKKFRVECDLFGDGHDVVNGALLYKPSNSKTWKEIPLNHIINDRWYAEFIPKKQGIYNFKIEGWVDHQLNWRYELKRKVDAGQIVDVELLDGIKYLKDLLKRVSKSEKTYLLSGVDLFEKGSIKETIDYALGNKLIGIFNKYPRKDFKTTYDNDLTVYVDRKKALFSSWYEFFPRSAGNESGKHGTFKDCIERLPYVAELGFDVLYFPPVHPIGMPHRKGKNNTVVAKPDDVGSPWAIGGENGGHKVIHPDLGTFEDFKSLINHAKELGIEVAMDYALQCAPDHPYVKEHPDWFKWRADGTVQYAENPPKKYQDILPINFETKDWKNLWKELHSILEFWIEAGVTIFRVDNPHTKPYKFWHWVIYEVKANHPDIIFLSEAFTRPKVMHELAKVGFTQSYSYYTWRNSRHEIEEYMDELVNGDGKYYFRPNFWPNTPDINPYSLQNGHPAMFMSRFFMAATLSSNYGIYGPVFENMIFEAFPGKEEYMNSEKYELKNWSWEIDTKLKHIIKKVNELRKIHPALQDTYNYKACNIDNEQIIAYYKESEDKKDQLLMVVNLDPHYTQSGWLQLPLDLLEEKAGHHFTVTDLLSENSYLWDKEWNFVELNPASIPFHLFKITH
ncbi:alpha-1,4-glucan--maltose-1-phosphate maltosyltransferase [Marinigracilibium pacificum]|uniref:Alpha-1,4-glucan:maltose-1-phosphate maltosyltransferase n=1 Tax=Marinigracilibium pacificum TaxID=2729599 RepID=A0A848IYC1_9BACT|nr:alpha-1,4-glucan--maltose-1-phosphate maltosyltransferase [Marinigracilibium pacificum]NMM48168.1 alpha-1,4-glucan--maltose-1-phosphate maltosyltransferase [Marinigracilibium pacificum]